VKEDIIVFYLKRNATIKTSKQQMSPKGPTPFLPNGLWVNRQAFHFLPFNEKSPFPG
jgi:hypothetical protein